MSAAVNIEEPMGRHALMSIAIARGQEVCVAYVNDSQLLGESIEALFGALSKLQEYDDDHATDGPSES